MPIIVDNIQAEALLQTRSWRIEPLIQATAAGTLTLTSTSSSVTIFTGTATGQIVSMPNATTLLLGHRYEFHNNSTQSITINENDATFLGTLTPNQRALIILQDNSTAGGVWSIQLNDLSAALATVHNIFEDFFFTALSQLDVFHFLDFAAAGGTATIETTAPTDNTYIGKVICATGTLPTGTNNNTGVGGFESSTGTSKIKAGGADLSLEFRVRLPVLSGTPQYNVKMGLMDSNALGTPANGVYFIYSSTINGGAWQGDSRNASTSSTVNSTVTVAANTWYKMLIQINKAGTRVDFIINDTLIGFYSGANIPVTNATRIMFRIEKQGNASATSRTLEVDSVYYRVER